MSSAPAGVDVHANGICESANVGEGTRVWAFAHVLPGARIGRDCNICDQVFIENDVVVGDRVTIKSGVQLWDGVRLGADVFVGPNASFTNDRFPRSKMYPETFGVTTVERGASIGANATILPGITVGQYAMIGAGAVVTADVPPRAVVVGNPGRVVHFAGSLDQIRTLAEADEEEVLGGGGCRLVPLTTSADIRGALGVIDHERDLPFSPMRTFFVSGVPDGAVRGIHAHHACDQFLVVTTGALTALVDDGRASRSIRLDAPTHGLYVPAGTWGTQTAWAPGTTLVVFASRPWEKDDYIHSYAAFLDTKTPRS